MAATTNLGTSNNTPHASSLAISGLARALVQHGKLGAEVAENLTKNASIARVSFIDQLLTSKSLSALELATAASQIFRLPLLELDAFDPGLMQVNIIDKKLVQNLKMVALHKRGNTLTVAISDPTNLQALDQIKFQTQLQVEPVIVEHPKLVELANKLSQSVEVSLNELVGNDISLDLGDIDVEIAEESNSSNEIDDAPVVRFLQKILMDAINDGASDIHFEPYEKFYRIRFRVDGVLREIAQPPLVIRDKLASRIKVISRLDISEKRVPQDGRLKLVLSKNRAIDFRVSTLPTLYGEKIVMRILDPTQARMGIDSLGFDPAQKTTVLSAINRPHGMVLVTGPTGSGKTITLYTCINILNQPDINISTAEDPAEIQLPGINQVTINEKTGLSFATVLKSFLRQDPDVIMVGEIRDRETADIAIKAAQTGHLVFSTLHTNDAPSTLVRLINMGIATFNVASSILLVIAQRLVRRLCTCKKPLEISTQALLDAGFLNQDLDDSWHPYAPLGCDLCKGSGYKGRLGIFQVMPITEAIQRIVLENGNVLQISEQAQREGVITLRRSGLLKVKQGHTSLEEILALTSEASKS